VTEVEDDLFITSSSLSLTPLEAKHFAHDGTLHVACLGQIEAKFWESDSSVNSFNGAPQHQRQQQHVLKVMESQWPSEKWSTCS